MKILIVNSFDRGGAANACLRLHKGLLDVGIDSSVLLQHKENDVPNSQVFVPLPKKKSYGDRVRNKIKRILFELKLYKPKPIINQEQVFLESRKNGLELFSFPTSKCDITESKLYKEADIINLHWVAGFLDYKTFFKKNTKPVVWTLHDMNAFSGGEHYEESFLGIDPNGNPVKREITEAERLVHTNNIKFKADIISKSNNLSIVCPSKWLQQEAQKSHVFKDKPVYHIPYGLDSTIFKIRNKNFSRDLLGIPLDKKVILFVADSISNHRKGFAYLKKAFEKLDREDVVLCAIGNKSGELASLNNIQELGPVNDEKLMSVVYSAADVFVIPSLMDNLPNTVLESLLCGTPVIGFPVGGITDMVQDGVNGLLANEISVDALWETLSAFLNTIDTFDCEKIRQDAVNKYDLKIQANAYFDLFESIF